MSNNKKLISFIIYSDKGFFKKPDINDGIYLTYNFIHKPAVLGIFGAIIGLKGFEKSNSFPEYYIKLRNIPIGIKPIGAKKGSFIKTTITYNNTTGFASEKKGDNLIVTEQTLIKPAFKIYLLINLENDNEEKLFKNIKNQKAEFLPYMGKNDYSLWWNKEEVKEYFYEEFNPEKDFVIDTIFIKDEPIIKNLAQAMGRRALAEQADWFIVFEKLPYKYDENLFQYALKDFVYSNAKLNVNSNFNNGRLFLVKDNNKKERVVYLF